MSSLDFKTTLFVSIFVILNLCRLFQPTNLFVSNDAKFESPITSGLLLGAAVKVISGNSLTVFILTLTPFVGKIPSVTLPLTEYLKPPAERNSTLSPVSSSKL